MGTPGKPAVGTPRCPPQSAPSRSCVPLVPTEEEAAGLPRAAFLDRCAPPPPASSSSPLTAQLRCIRRDFVRLQRLARKEKWTDDTPVPPGVFGPMWPEGVEPYWAAEPPPASPQAAAGE